MTKQDIGEKVTQFGIASAIMVTYIHVMLLDNTDNGSPAWWIGSLFQGGLFAIAVPFFFTVSGYFLAVRMDDEHWWRTAISKRIRSLAVPYIFWSLIVTVFGFAVLTIVPKSQIPTIVIPGGLARWQRLPNIHDLLWSPPLYPFWYIRMLLCLVVVSPLIKWILDKLGLILITTLFVLCLVINLIPQYMPEPIVKLLVTTFPVRGALYFTVGIWLQREKFSLDVTRQVAQTSLFIGLGFFFLRSVAILHHHTELADCCVTCGIPLTLVGLWKFCPTPPVPFARASFPIFVLHTPVLFSLEVVFAGLLGFNMHGSILCYVLEGAVAVYLSTLLAIPIRKFIPWSFGNR